MPLLKFLLRHGTLTFHRICMILPDLDIHSILNCKIFSRIECFRLKSSMIRLSHCLHENCCRREFLHPILSNKAYALVFAVAVQVGKRPNTVVPNSKSVLESSLNSKFFATIRFQGFCLSEHVRIFAAKNLMAAKKCYGR